MPEIRSIDGKRVKKVLKKGEEVVVLFRKNPDGSVPSDVRFPNLASYIEAVNRTFVPSATFRYGHHPELEPNFGD